MQTGQLLDSLIHILGQETQSNMVQAYLAQILADSTGPAWMILYEPDATQRTLQPTIQWLSEKRYASQQAEAVMVDDLEHPVSATYVMQRAQQFALHSRVSTSSRFQRMQDNFNDNPNVQLEPLQAPGQTRPIAVLLIIRADGTITNRAIWAKQLGLLATLIDQQHKKRQQMDLHDRLQDAAEQKRQQARIEEVQKQVIGTDPASHKVQQGIVSAANNRLSVLIRGETGCGKDLVAAQIHQLSGQTDAPFVAVNCAALPAELVEAELFGSARGAYTGSVSGRVGLIENAQGGVLFLDEIGDMPHALQAVLLRVLNEKTYRKIGENQERQADFRLICATNAPLEEMMQQGGFRKDLYYRIRQIQLTLPTLRQHLQDIPALASHLVKQYNLETGQYQPPLSNPLIRLLQEHDWPGNVRELKHFIYAYLAQHAPPQSGLIAPFRRALQEWRRHNGVLAPPHTTDMGQLLNTHDLPRASATFEKTLIVERLKRFNGNRAKAAKSLGIPKRTLAYKCQKLHINTEALTIP